MERRCFKTESRRITDKHFYDILKQRKTVGPLYAPSLLPRGNVSHTTCSKDYDAVSWEHNTRWFLWEDDISACREHYNSQPQPQVGVKYHPEGWKRLPNCGCGSMTTGRKSARGIQKIRLNVVHKSLIRGKLYCLPTYNLAKNIVTEELFGLCCDLFMNQFVIDRRHFLQGLAH